MCKNLSGLWYSKIMSHSLLKDLPLKVVFGLLLLILVGFGVYTIETRDKKEADDTPLALTEKSREESFMIVAYGDSLTAGYGNSLEESYPALLQEYLQKQNKNVTILNMGVSGETTSGSLDRIDFILSQKPSLVLLGTGANDMLRSTSPQLVETNLRKILDRLKQEKVPVILLGMKSVASNGSVYQKEFDAIYPSLAKEYSLAFVPFFLEGVALQPELNNSDGIHPNKAGYEKIIKDTILPILLPILASKGI
jgi:acyl-CoA thioesterase-1